MPFLVDGTMHTTLLGEGFGLPGGFEELLEVGSLQTSSVDGQRFSAWMQQMLDDDPAWAPVYQ